MDIDVQVKGHGPIPGKAFTQYAVSVEFDGPIETITMTVIVPSEDATEARAISRAKELARLFAAQA
jgi:hypothetical protein